jgi:hypothetical protein
MLRYPLPGIKCGDPRPVATKANNLKDTDIQEMQGWFTDVVVGCSSVCLGIHAGSLFGIRRPQVPL